MLYFTIQYCYLSNFINFLFEMNTHLQRRVQSMLEWPRRPSIEADRWQLQQLLPRPASPVAHR
jgi:hypothetical protein